MTRVGYHLDIVALPHPIHRIHLILPLCSRKVLELRGWAQDLGYYLIHLHLHRCWLYLRWLAHSVYLINW